MSSRKNAVLAPERRSPPRVLRAYFECRYGQLHVLHAMPGGGGFDEATPVLCLPGAGGTGHEYAALLPLLGIDRSVYAIDVPGCGMSDPSPEGPGDAACVAAVADLLGTLRLRCVDLVCREARLPAARQARAQLGERLRRMAVLVSAPGEPRPQADESALRLAPSAFGSNGALVEAEAARIAPMLADMLGGG